MKNVVDYCRNQLRSNEFAEKYLASVYDYRVAIFLAITAISLMVYLLAPFYGVLPLTNINFLGAVYSALGNIECTTKMGISTPCTYSGIPAGSYMTFGLPFAYISSLVQITTGVSVVEAYNIAGILFLLFGSAGIFLLIRTFGGNSWFSILGCYLFLIMPIVWGKSEYGFLMWGFVVLPFFIWLDVWYLNTQRCYSSLPVVFFSKAFLLFLEPYTFVMASVFTLAVISYEVISAIRKKSLHNKIHLKAIAFIGALSLAYVLYKMSIPGGAEYHVMTLDFFRGQGIDLIALFNRPDHMYAAGQIWNVSIPDPRLFYTDGEAVKHVYIGFGLLSVMPLLVIFSSRLRPYNWVLLGVGVVAFVLALGPSLKVNDRRDSAEITNQYITYDDYIMPENTATLSMPHSFIYEMAPFKYMRAVSRWYLLTNVALVVTLMVALTFLWRYDHRGKFLAILLVALTIIEYAPNAERRLVLIDTYTSAFNAFNATAMQEFRDSVKSDDTVLFIQDRGVEAEYFTTYLCSMAECKTYNVSTDKAIEIAKRQWPKEIYDVAVKPSKGAMIDLLESELLTVIVFPHFDMRWNSYEWPPDKKTQEKLAKIAYGYLGEDEKVVFDQREWFSYVRLR